MAIVALELLQFRNYSALSLELPSEGALFCGENGVGKTNILEAISFVTLGKSVRNCSIKEMVKKGEDSFFVQAKFLEKSIQNRQSVGFMKPHKLAITINGVTHNTLSSLYKSNRFIYFGPEDIQVITGAPEEKRRFLDQTISQRNPYYLQALIMYKKLLKERNALLFQKNDPTLFSLYNEQLAKSGMEILKQRRTFFNEIEKEFTRLYETIGKDTLQLRLHYNPSLNCTSLQEYKEILDISLEKDRELGYTSVGIHRDTYSCKTETIKMVGFGSQGQLRTAALSLKLASLVYLLHESSEPVIVAIDDAFSELDISRKKRFFKELQHEKVQLFMTIHSPEEASHYTLPLFYVTTEKGVYRAS